MPTMPFLPPTARCAPLGDATPASHTRSAWSTRRARRPGAGWRTALAAALLLLGGAVDLYAQGAPRGRAQAATTAFTDDDVAWILPLLDAAAADRRREETRAAASLGAVGAYMSADAAANRVEQMRGGAAHALASLRRYSHEAAVPGAARYDVACSVALTEAMGGLVTVAAFSVTDVPATAAFYQARGWRVLGGSNVGYVLKSPDGKLSGSLSNPLNQFRRVAADVQQRGLGGYDHVLQCTGIPDRTELLLQPADAMEAEADAAGAAASGGTSERLPDALHAAGLTEEQWKAVFDALWQAELDRLLPDTPSPAPASGEEAARRRANVRWLQRHGARVGPRLQATSTDG